MVDELCRRLIEDSEASPLDSEAVVDVVQIDPERLVESTVVLKGLSTRGHARSRYAGTLPSRNRKCKISRNGSV
jgi:hypothetical protein